MNDPEHVPGDRRLVAVYAWFILLTALLTFGIVSVVVMSQPQQHTATAEIELLKTPTRGAPLVPDVGTEREVALSGTVAREAAARLDTSVRQARSGLSASVVTDTNVLVVEYTAATGRAALRGAEAFTRSYVDTRNEAQRSPLAVVISEPELSAQGRPMSVPVLLVAGLLLGVGIGTAVAFVWDRARDRVRSPGELRRSGIEVLATGVVVPAEVTSGAADRPGNAGFLAGRLTALTDHARAGVTIVVTAPRDDTAGLAVLTASALAGLGRHVVLVGADGPPSRVDAVADGPATPGFADVLAGRVDLDSAVRPTRVAGLRLVGAGSGPRRELLDLDSLKVALGQLSARDIVVVSGPPLLGSTAGWLLAEQADVVVLAADLQRLRRRDVVRTLDLLQPLVHATVGWVVTSKDMRSRSGTGAARRRAELTRERNHAGGRATEVGGRPAP